MSPVSKKSESSPRDRPARKTEQQRERGQRACVECTRLKLKCDKQIPCQSCLRRGCAELCPNESLPTGKSAQSILAATEDLYRRLAKMRKRVRQLEDALSELQDKHSTEPHPLLRPDLLEASRRENDVGPPFADDPAFVEHTPELVEASGTMFTSDNGAPRFFGPTEGSYWPLMIDNVPSQDFADGPSTWLQRPGLTASPEQMREKPTCDQTPYTDTSSQFMAPPQTRPHRPMQARVETTVLPSCSGEELDFMRHRQPSFAPSLGQTQEMSNSPPTQFSASLRIPPHVPSEVSAHGELTAGSSTSVLPPESSDPYLVADVSTPCAQAHLQGFRPSHNWYDQHGHYPSTFSTSSTVSHHGAPFAVAGTYHYQSQPHHPIQPPPHQHQPTHSNPPQPQPVLLAPSELAQLGPVARESGLDQRWVSSTQFGFSMGNGYQG